MKISLNWLREFTDIKLSDEEIIERIGSRIGEVEAVEQYGEQFEGVVVGQIKEASDHEDADKLAVYQVDIGGKTIQVVAGDKNLEPGDLAAYLPPGIAVPSTFGTDEEVRIEKRKLRGVESDGMLASAAELGFSDDHRAVLVLDEDVNPGDSFADAYDLNDKIVEIENKALTHRPDCFGVIGFAREVAAVQGLKFNTPEWFTKGTPPSGEGLSLEVSIKIPQSCPRFTAQAFKDVEIKQSPVRVQAMLSRLEVRPINNVVDLTNYLMLMTGQPFHAFDYDKVSAKSAGSGVHIEVRFPKEGEKITLLDEREIEPHSQAAMVATSDELLSVGGSIGGADTEVDENTKNVIMEAANWDLYSIRTTSMRHGIFTEAVTRFARGQDPEMTLPVQAKAAELLAEWAGAKPASKLVDDYPGPRKPAGLSADYRRINDVLGLKLSIEDQQKVLEDAEFDVSINGDNLDILAPSWRDDIHITEDVAEEIGRISGYDTIPVTLPFKTLMPVAPSKLNTLARKVRSVLSAAGANEQLSYNFVSEKFAVDSGYELDQLYRIRNALSPELQYLRPSLLSSVVNHVYANHRQGYGKLMLYEINKGHSKNDIGEDGLPHERLRLAAVFSADDKTASSEFAGVPYYQASHYLRYLLSNLGVAFNIGDYSSPDNFEDLEGLLHSKRRAQIIVDDRTIGLIGEFEDKVHGAFKLPLFAAGFEIDLEALNGVMSTDSTYQPISKYPGTTQDVTFKAPADTKFADMQDLLSEKVADENMLVSVEPLDVYQDESDSSSKNLTYRVKLKHTKKTMKTTEVNEQIDQAVSHVEKQFSAKRI